MSSPATLSEVREKLKQPFHDLASTIGRARVAVDDGADGLAGDELADAAEAMDRLNAALALLDSIPCTQPPEIDDVRKEAERFRKALEFYADHDNYEDHDNEEIPGFAEADVNDDRIWTADCGYVARVALGIQDQDPYREWAEKRLKPEVREEIAAALSNYETEAEPEKCQHEFKMSSYGRCIKCGERQPETEPGEKAARKPSRAHLLRVIEIPERNERRYRCTACDTEFMVPLDDAVLPAERECDGCHHLLRTCLTEPNKTNPKGQPEEEAEYPLGEKLRLILVGDDPDDPPHTWLGAAAEALRNHASEDEDPEALIEAADILERMHRELKKVLSPQQSKGQPETEGLDQVEKQDDWKPRAGEPHPVDKAFYDLTVKERDHERVRADRFERERDEVLAELKGDGR